MIAEKNIKKLKVVLLAKWYPDRKDPQLGVFIQKHARCIAETCDVTVFHARSDDALTAGKIESEVCISGGVIEHLWYYGPYKGILSPFNGLLYLQCWTRFKRVVRLSSEKPDLLHAYIMLRTGLLARFEANRLNIPYVVSEQWSGYATGKFGNKPLWWRVVWRGVLKKAAGISAVSSFLKEKMELYCKRLDIEVFYNVIESVSSNATSRTIDKPYILVVADLVDEIKNISGVIKAYATVKPYMQLRIIGGGKDLYKLEKLCKELGLENDQVVFEGMQPNKVVYTRLYDCAFLVMNSRFETFSSVCAEALSCGKPVIATRCGGPQEFIGKEHGILIDPDNRQQLENALEKMSTEFPKYDPMELNRYAMSKFGKSSIGLSYRKWYMALLEQAGKHH
ncbi:MAG: glycosyltransferase [Bacteroidota bacterium]